MIPSLGRIVHYQPAFGGEPKAAIIVLARLRDGLYHGSDETHYRVDLAVFMPDSDPSAAGGGGLYFYHDVPYVAEGAPGGWSWPPRVP